MLGTAFESLGAPIHYYGELIGLTSLTPDLGIVLRRSPALGIRILRSFAWQKHQWKPYAFEADHLDVRQLLRVFQTTAGLHVAKVFWNHLSDPALEDALATFRPTVIFLRRNHYDRLVSHLRARQNGAWHGRPYVEDEVHVTEEMLQSYASDYTSWYLKTRAMCDKLGLPIFDVAFDDLVAPNALRELIASVCGDIISPSQLELARPATERQATGSPSTDEELHLRRAYAFPGVGRASDNVPG